MLSSFKTAVIFQLLSMFLVFVSVVAAVIIVIGCFVLHWSWFLLIYPGAGLVGSFLSAVLMVVCAFRSKENRSMEDWVARL